LSPEGVWNHCAVNNRYAKAFADGIELHEHHEYMEHELYEAVIK
jgi:hypothetical protein